MDEFDIRYVRHPKGTVLCVDAGPQGTERVVPPAGEAYAFDRPLWARRIQVSVSPKGKSVRVFVDGAEITKQAGQPEGSNSTTS